MNLELFCCSGGMAEGFRRAGILIDLAFDKSPDACASYEANLGHRPVQMDVRDLLRMVRAGWRPAGGVHLLIADPPCAPWSRAGRRRGTEDDRDMLEETCDLIALLRPQAYLIGNVPGLDDATNDKVVHKFIGGLGKHGYCTADYARLDAADHGVPQHRVRPFWFGHLGGPCIRWPPPTHCDPRELQMLPLPGYEPLLQWVTCREALGHLSLGEAGRLVCQRKNYRHPSSRPNRPNRPSRTMLANSLRSQNGAGTIAIDPPRWALPQSGRVYGPDEPAPSIQARTDRKKNGAATLAWPWDRPATTVCAGIDKIAAAGEHSGHHAPNAIILSERAAAILQGFPEGWLFSGKTKQARWTQLGQAMPPPLAEAVARSVKAQAAR